MIDLWELENEIYDSGLQLLCGVDEAGRGPLAGPVYAAAVILPRGLAIEGLNDSKKLSEKRREELFERIMEKALYARVVMIGPEEIDRINILAASITGMQRAVLRLDPRPDFLLVDGNRFRPFDTYGFKSYRTVVHGDATYASIAAASVLAKTHRDEFMRKIAAEYPEYGWEHNMGYPTPDHIAAIRANGYTPWHRRSFIVKELEPSLF